MKEVGAWLKQNGAAIYATRTTPNYNCGKVWFTANKDGKTLYAIYALPEKETLPATIEWEGNEPTGKMTMLQNGKSVKYSCKGGKVTVTLPEGLKMCIRDSFIPLAKSSFALGKIRPVTKIHRGVDNPARSSAR